MTAARVVQVLATSTGGIGTHVASLTRGLVAQGYAVTVAGPGATDELFGFSRMGAEFAEVPIGSGLRSLAAVASRRLRELCRETDLVHAHGARAGLVASTSVRSGTCPLVVSWHNAPLGRGVGAVTHSWLERRVARAADVTLAASGDLADRARAAGARDVRLLAVAPPRQTPRRTPAEVRAELGIADRPLVLAIGRLHPQKRFDSLVAAAALLRERVPGLAVVIAGDGPLRDELESAIAAADAPVELLGRRTDTADLLSAADVVALPSQWEARSLVAYEALLAGRALVTTSVGGIPELVGDAAAFVPVGDADALAQELARLLTDRAARADLEQRALRRAATFPTEEDTLKVVMDVYAELVGRAR